MTQLESPNPGQSPARSPLQSIADAVARHYKDQFGRGPHRCRAHFAGRDSVLVVLEGTMSPAERRLAELGEIDRVRGARAALQSAVQDDLLDAVRAVAGRGVEFAVPGMDLVRDVATELFVLTPVEGVERD
ncbi:Na-translocating system protein MpsC family protein [Patulibacter minatonensis]|uniref:Na-translocating system protein MpsC family protein n=1 Tax=Patulibacter minatonensis TaxID=298163 RepID=UPI0009FD2014|nr:Na-translocating system protein MpsC family protein [Patulibacter minatonensis]